MLPHNHFLIAGLLIAPVGIFFFPEKPVTEIGEWVLIGGIISSAIDLDIYTLVILRSEKDERLKIFRNPLEIYRKFKPFMDTITDTGVLNTGVKSHLFFSAFIILAGYFLLNSYFMPIVLGVGSHLISDILDMRRIIFT